MDIINLSSCWDFGNYFFPSEDYYTNKGIQAKALKKMIDRTLEARDESTYDYSSGNMNQYNGFEMFFSELWRVTTNWDTYILQINQYPLWFLMWILYAIYKVLFNV